MGSFFSSSTTSKPPQYIGKYLKDITGLAGKALHQGGGYNGSLVTPFSKQTRAGMKQLMSTANEARNGGYSDLFRGILDNGGLTAGQGQVTSNMRDMADSGLLNELINNGTGLTAAQQRALTTSEAAGNKIGAYADQIAGQGGLTADQQAAMDRWRGQISTPFALDNPGYSTVRQNALNDQKDALTSRALAFGRYGSGADQAILAREQGRLGAALDNAEYIRQEAQDDAAANNMFQGGQTATTNIPTLYGATQDAVNKTAGLSQQGVANNMAALSAKSALENNIFNQEQARLGNASTAYDALQAPAKTALTVGAMNEDLYSRMLADRQRMAMQPIDLLSRFASMMNGAPVGTTQSTTPGLGQLTIGGLLGLSALGGLGGSSTAT